MESNAFLSKEEQAPLTACQKCKDRPCIKTGKICDEVEKLLKPLTTGRRNWLSYCDPVFLENYSTEDKVLIRGKRGKNRIEEAVYVSKGKRRKPRHSIEE